MRAACVEREYEFSVVAPIDLVADLLSDVRQLDRLTPSWFGLVVEGDKRPMIREGTEIEYRLEWRGLRRRWRSRIVEWRPPRLFTYQQAEGPFVFFEHEHLLIEVEDGTRVIDRVSYRVPAGRWVDRLLVAPDLERIFAYRAAAVCGELEDRSRSRDGRDSLGSRLEPIA